MSKVRSASESPGSARFALQRHIVGVLFAFLGAFVIAGHSYLMPLTKPGLTMSVSPLFEPWMPLYGLVLSTAFFYAGVVYLIRVFKGSTHYLEPQEEPFLLLFFSAACFLGVYTGLIRGQNGIEPWSLGVILEVSFSFVSFMVAHTAALSFPKIKKDAPEVV